MIRALIDIPATNGVPDLTLPNNTEVTRRGKFRHLLHPSGGQLWTYTMLQTQTRWVAVAVGTASAFQWLQAQGVTGWELTREFYQANQTQLENLGLTVEVRRGLQAFRVPHVICGQSPWVYLED